MRIKQITGRTHPIKQTQTLCSDRAKGNEGGGHRHTGARRTWSATEALMDERAITGGNQRARRAMKRLLCGGEPSNQTSTNQVVKASRASGRVPRSYLFDNDERGTGKST